MTTQPFYPRSLDGCISPDGSLSTPALLKVYSLVKSAKFLTPTALNLEVIERSLYDALGFDGRMDGGFFALSLTQSVFHPRPELSELLGARHRISLRFLSSSEVRLFGGDRMLLGEAEAKLPSGRTVVHRLFLPALAARAEDLAEFERRCMSLATFAVLGLCPIAEGVPMAPLKTDAIAELRVQSDSDCTDWLEVHNRELYKISLECGSNKDLYVEQLVNLDLAEEDFFPRRKLPWEMAKRDLSSVYGLGDYFDELLRRKEGHAEPSLSASPTPESPPEAVSSSESSEALVAPPVEPVTESLASPMVDAPPEESTTPSVEWRDAEPTSPLPVDPASLSSCLAADVLPSQDDAQLASEAANDSGEIDSSPSESTVAPKSSVRSFDRMVQEQSEWVIGLIRESGSEEDARKAIGLLPLAASQTDRRRARGALRAILSTLRPPKGKKKAGGSANEEPTGSEGSPLTSGELGRYELPGAATDEHWWNHLVEKKEAQPDSKYPGGGVAGAYAKRQKQFKLTGVDDIRLGQTVRMVAEIRGHGELEALTFVRDIVKHAAKFEGPKLPREPWKSSAE